MKKIQLNYDDMSESYETNSSYFPSSTTAAGAVLASVAAEAEGDGLSTLSSAAFNMLSSNLSEYIRDTLTLNKSNAAAPAVDGEHYTPIEIRPETYIIPILFFIIFVIGVIGNGTLIIVFFRHRAMRNVPNTYILSLALADLLLIVTTVPFTSIVYTFQEWPWGYVMCKLSEFIKDLSIGVSVFTLTALSGDRFFAIVDPLKKFITHSGSYRATCLTVTITLLIWLLAIIFSLPSLLGSYIREIRLNETITLHVCYPFPPEWGDDYAKGIVLAKFLIYYAIPLFIIGIFYVLIARHLIHSASNVPGEMQGTQRQVQARRKVAITVITFVVIFGVCFLPSHVFMLWFYYNPSSQLDYNSFWHILRMVGFVLSFGNSCANPVALYCVSGAFRKHFNRYLLCRNSSNPGHPNHRDTAVTSTISRRYPSRRLGQQSTIRRVQETTITLIPNGNQNGNNRDIDKDTESCL